MSLVLTDTHAGVATLSLNRPERRNALSGALVEALIAALDEAMADDAVHAVALTGQGKAFCAGGDLAGGMGGSGFLEGHRGRGRYAELLASMRTAPKPIVAGVHGDALGGGLGVAVGCDLVIADPGARFGTPEIKVGLFPWIILAVLQRNVPRKQLMELVLTGDRIDAERAVALGLANRLSVEGQAVAEAQELAARVGSRSPAVLAMGKAAFARVEDLAFEDALAHLHAQLSLNLLTEDAAEGIGAFLQKREPEWKGR